MRRFTITIDIETSKEVEKVEAAINKGIFYGLDIKNIAPPKKVKVNSFSEIKNK